MPRKGKVVKVTTTEEVEQEEIKNTKTSSSPIRNPNVLKAGFEDDDLADFIIALDPKLASIYLMIEKASERASEKTIKKFLEAMAEKSKENEMASKLDEILLNLALVRYKERLNERKEMKKLMTPLLINKIIESQVQAKFNECIRTHMAQSILNGMTPNLPQIQQLCQQEVQSYQMLINSLLPQLLGGDLANLFGALNAIPQSTHQQPKEEQNENEVEIEGDEYDTL